VGKRAGNLLCCPAHVNIESRKICRAYSLLTGRVRGKYNMRKLGNEEAR
jgi:hypothetical protein